MLLGLEAVEKTGTRSWYFELGGNAVVDSLPGVPGDTRFLGTFDRQEALEREEIDYFATGHPLVEGLLQELEDGARGRAALVELAGSGQRGLGIVALRGPSHRVVAEVLDLQGRPRPDWVLAVVERRRELRPLTNEAFTTALPRGFDWAAFVEGIGRSHGEGLRALAGIRLT
jgi:ATP-dependent helicase HepA